MSFWASSSSVSYNRSINREKVLLSEYYIYTYVECGALGQQPTGRGPDLLPAIKLPAVLATYWSEVQVQVSWVKRSQ